uniref:Uncharacterized protein PFB0145c-like n=1 Tax=Saccoglossus kowalevskii TaxID=10224 RepID=A0ABM0LZA7_SACKO|nr:PREDICTED: uncharacterized protein PFB0145c-like [Saccoglossus kowalevskii]
MVENAHRAAMGFINTSKRPESKQRHIILKIYRRPQRMSIIKKTKAVFEQSNIFVTEDYCPAKKIRKTGIVSTWKECHQATNGYPGNCFKGVDTYEEAEQHVLLYNNNESILRKNTHCTSDNESDDYSDQEASIPLTGSTCLSDNSTFNSSNNNRSDEFSDNDNRIRNVKCLIASKLSDDANGHHLEKPRTVNQAMSTPLSHRKSIEKTDFELMFESIEDKYLTLENKCCSLEDNLATQATEFDKFFNEAKEKERKFELETKSQKDQNCALLLEINEVKQMLKSLSEKWQNNLLNVQTVIVIETKNRQDALAREWKPDFQNLENSLISNVNNPSIELSIDSSAFK